MPQFPYTHTHAHTIIHSLLPKHTWSQQNALMQTLSVTCSQLALFFAFQRDSQPLIFFFLYWFIGSICHCCRQCSRYFFLERIFWSTLWFPFPHDPKTEETRTIYIVSSCKREFSGFEVDLRPSQGDFVVLLCSHVWHPRACVFICSLYHFVLHYHSFVIIVCFYFNAFSLIQTDPLKCCKNAQDLALSLSHSVTLRLPLTRPLEGRCWISGFRKLVVPLQVT